MERQGMDPKLFELGVEVVELRNKLDDMNQEKIDLQNTISNLEQKILDSEKEVSDYIRMKNSYLAIERSLDMANRDLVKRTNELNVLKTKFSESEKERKELKSLDPISLKKKIKKGKDKISELNNKIKIYENKISDLNKDKESSSITLKQMLNENDCFYLSEDKRWGLKLTGFRFDDEDRSKRSLRIRCIDYKTGTSVIAVYMDDNQKVVWSHDIEVPEEVGYEAGRNMKSLLENGSLVNEFSDIIINQGKKRAAV